MTPDQAPEGSGITPIELANDELAIAVLPAIGGGLARFDRLGGTGRVALFRPWDGVTAEPNALACYPLLPFSNRLGGGGIEAGGRFWALPANMAPDPHPLHGDGWQKPWSVLERSAAHLALGLESRDLQPFDYSARLSYALEGPAMTMRLEVQHQGMVPVPYGLGFHPWLPRTPGTALEAPADRVWLERPDHLPDREVSIDERPDWDFRTARPLPASWINNAFTGWNGNARVEWAENGLGLSVDASAPLATLMLYSPAADCGFFCLEPVSHPVDAHRLPGQPGLRLLHPGEGFAISCRFTATEI
jgi:aldose 1-epimerase